MMQPESKFKYRGIKKIIISIFAVMIIIVGAFTLYVSDYYRAEEEALSILEEDSAILKGENYIALQSLDSGESALIFYPGAKVEYTAYLPILNKIREQGITCILIKMPFNMAIFDKNAANSVIQNFPEIKNWYIGGHSMGGAMASSYASENPESIKGLILLGAYLYGEYPTEKTLTIYGSLNTSVAEKVDYTEHVVVIEGGNHAQFGNYGKQKGDADATISTQEQQEQAVKEMVGFIETNHQTK